MSELRYDGRVAIITGAGGGLGRAYAILLAAKGAAVVVNDLGGSRHGEGASSSAADLVVAEIRNSGGHAVADYNSVEDGQRIVETALKHFGKVDILINNAGILRDKSFLKMTEQDWELVQRVHVRGAYKVTKAAWDVFQKQGYVMTASAAGIYGNYGQANYGSAKLALYGLAKSLAREGERKNIRVNAIAPLAASRITETAMPTEILRALKPEHVAPFVAYLCHESCLESGSLFEAGAGYAAKLRLERSSGVLLRTDDPSFTPAAVAQKFKQACDFSTPQYPQAITDVDWVGLAQKAQELQRNAIASELCYDGKAVLITGAGGGLGRAYALMFGSLRAKVIVNDVSKKAADAVVETIKRAGGQAVADYNSVEDGKAIVDTAVRSFGRIDVVVNNAGILRDKSFAKMTDDDWDLVQRVHLYGAFMVIQAAWPVMLKQRYGRIINTCSAVGLYGNFGQANYSAAKAGILGLSNTLAIEGQKHGILVNTIAPNAGTQMTATVMPKDIVAILKPEYVAPFVAYLAHESTAETGGIFEVGSGWIAKVRWQRSDGYGFAPGKPFTVENVQSVWPKIIDFSAGATHPTTAQESFARIHQNTIQSRDTAAAASPATAPIHDEKHQFDYSTRDVCLYNLGVGCEASELKYVYENASDFAPLPTFAVIPAMEAMLSVPLGEYLQNFNPAMLLHGEQYLEILAPLPPSGKLVSIARPIEISNKGKGVVVVLQVTTSDMSGNQVAINEGTLFIRGVSSAGTFAKQPIPRREGATLNATIPNRPADAIKKQIVPDNQAAFYRLSGDYNPLHMDPQVAAMAGFKRPILHGLCSYGYAARHILQKFGGDSPASFKYIKARFVKHVFPGETLQTEMWKVSETRIVFQVRVLERDELVMANACVELGPIKAKNSVSSPGTEARQTKTGELFVKFEKIFEVLPPELKTEQIKKVGGVFQFEIKGATGNVEPYFIDLKNGQGAIGAGKTTRPDITIAVADDDFLQLVSGALKPQAAFMKGLVKVKGQMMLALKLDGVLKALSSHPKAKL